ncbi:MAG: YajG family lipoprotein [Thermodesulfobacteriota bacterium]
MRQFAFLIFILAFFCSSCALTPQQVNIKPDVQVRSTNIGQNKKITLTTVDERLSSTIGNRGVAGFGADITSAGDVAQIVESAIIEGLNKQGFDTSGSLESDPRELRVEIRNLEYSLKPGIFTGTLRTECALKGICNINGKRQYEHLYRGGSEEQVLVAQFAEENANHINKALTQVIVELLDDSNLTSCLAD